MIRRHPRIALSLLGAFLLGVAGVIAANALVVISSSGDDTKDVAA